MKPGMSVDMPKEHMANAIRWASVALAAQSHSLTFLKGICLILSIHFFLGLYSKNVRRRGGCSDRAREIA